MGHSITRRVLSLLEWLVSVLLSAVILWLLIERARSAGGLWRDECGALQLARLPTWLQVQQMFQFEAFPLLFPAVIRTLTNWLGTEDAVLRGYGAAVGALLLASLWWNSWGMLRRPPLLTLTLLGLNPTLLTWGTTVRGYGIASAFITMAFACIGTLSLSSRRWSFAAAALFSFLSVQFALHNLFLIAAICASAGVVLGLRREWIAVAQIGGIALLCGLSILPYWAGYHSAEWTMLVRVPVTFVGLLQKMFTACGGDVPALLWIWIATFTAALLLAIGTLTIRYWRPGPEANSDTANQIPYALGVLLLAPAAYLVFLRLLSYPTQPWYYLMFMMVLGCSIEVILRRFSQHPGCRVLLLLVTLAPLPWLIDQDRLRVQVRQTNLDLVADQLTELAAPEDLIVLTPWYLGVSYRWHFRGETPWMTIPPIADLTVHRYDLFKERMLSQEPLGDLAAEIERTLQSGHRLWMVGELLPVPPEGPHVLPLPPAPVTGWMDEAYRIAWTEQTIAFLQRHGLSFTHIEVPVQQPISNAERADVWMVQGWRD